MKVCVVFLICSLYITTVYAMDPILVGTIVSQANTLTAPFQESAFARLKKVVFGDDRAARSTDVILFNKSSKDFKLKSNSCKWGGWTSQMFPEHEILNHSSSVFRMESNGFMTGVHCKALYRARDGTFFEVDMNNPYWHRNKIDSSHSDSLEILGTDGQGNNNNVRWIIQDA